PHPPVALRSKQPLSPRVPAPWSGTTRGRTPGSWSRTPRPYTPASTPCPSPRSGRPPAPVRSKSPGSSPHLQAHALQLLLHRGDRNLAEVKDGRGQRRVRASLGQRVVHVPRRARTSRRDHGQSYRTADRACQLDVVTRVRAVAVHRREQDLPRARSEERRVGKEGRS